MSVPFNQLTHAEVERLAMLAEECGEVIPIIGKILRHGPNSNHPNDQYQTPNSELLEAELIDVLTVIARMELARDIRVLPEHRSVETVERWHKKLPWTHHQEARK